MMTFSLHCSEEAVFLNLVYWTNIASTFGSTDPMSSTGDDHKNCRRILKVKNKLLCPLEYDKGACRCPEKPKQCYLSLRPKILKQANSPSSRWKIDLFGKMSKSRPENKTKTSSRWGKESLGQESTMRVTHILCFEPGFLPQRVHAWDSSPVFSLATLQRGACPR